MCLQGKNHFKEEILNVLLSLKLHHLEKDQIADGHLSQKQKKKREEMSKKERKMAKQQAKLDKELLEAKAEESKETRLKFATQISNLLFAIYFRLLKNPNMKILTPVLTGLAKFGHLMSIDYFQDLLKVLNQLLEDFQVKNGEKLLCIQTVFAILSGQGEALTLDPSKFYEKVDEILSNLEAKNFDLAAAVCTQAYIQRRKKISKSTLIKALKKVGVACLKSQEAGPLMEFLKECIKVQPTSVVNNLMVKDDDVEVHDYNGFMVWEIPALVQHVDPTAAKNASQILGNFSVSEVSGATITRL